MADFLLELLSEEIPARMQARARGDLAKMFAGELEKAGLETGAIDVHSTPRRLVLIARDVAAQTAAAREEIKGPKASAPPAALDGFLRKTGLAREQLEERDGVLFAVIDRPGRPAAAVIGDALGRILADFPWPKSMRWGGGSERWVRPLHGIVALLGEDIVPFEIGGIASGATTLGHRFHHPGPITIGGAGDYAEKLRACHVIVDQDERERLIREGADKAAADAGLKLLADEGLVVENAGLTEWPVPLLGRFDSEYLDVPREVIVLTMRTNQKYFACTDDGGALAPAFVCIANIDANDGGAAIVEGNRRVLAARLADARFFWEQDLKVPLEEQAKKLDQIVFHEKLGTLADKVERVAKLARWLVEEGVVKGADAEQVQRAARLAKADLVTGMVGEFPELQGVIGGYLARAQGEPDSIADAVRDHYKPVGQGEEMPTSPVTVAVALADKLDSVFLFPSAGMMPTGSSDPYAIRRVTIAVIRLLIANDVRLPLRAALRVWYDLLAEMCVTDSEGVEYVGVLRRYHEVVENDFAYTVQRYQPKGLPSNEWEELTLAFVNSSDIEYHKTFGLDANDEAPFYYHEFNSPADIIKAVWSFLADRLKVQQREAGVRHDLIDAVFALGGEDDLVRLLARVKALQEFVATPEGADLLVAYKRAANILKRENWTAPQVMSSAAEQGIPQTGEEDPLVLVEEPGMAEAIAEMASGSAGADLPQEQALVAALDKAEPEATAAVEAEDFTRAMAALARLRGPIDEFFDHVTVNDPDPATRERRLNLLLRFRDAVHRVADFSKIEG
ncbi:glycine--tRNA ligase subunit beta [Sphingomonas sp.]|uniref:glycine--tRNA ligase subunit beta n=1 Tax=Sphingomonas sp. TaxID=28214 RepID=UPI001839C777|nr:glycine--tRNA ligase subunit beta [Sphingomonas sp.]MBA3511033.1 glycine--tRNA ligase subunit beta [Sphingomonas sp.]